MCPDCGAMPGRVMQTGYDDRDRRIRLRRCQTCEARYTTVELPVPASFYDLCDSYRHRQVLRSRLVRGYHDLPMGRYPRRRPVLVIDVKVVPPRQAA